MTPTLPLDLLKMTSMVQPQGYIVEKITENESIGSMESTIYVVARTCCAMLYCVREDTWTQPVHVLKF